MLIDVGVNLTNDRFRKDRLEVVERAVAAGVGRMVVTGTSVAVSEAAADLAAARPGVLSSTAGIHPHDSARAERGWEDALRRLARRPEVVAVGECGLDFDRDYSPRPDQRRVFAAQLEIAAELGLPVFLHERAAHEALLELLDPVLPRLPAAVIHCFTGSPDELAAYLERDLYVGVTGWICDERRGGCLQQLVGRIPTSRLLLETDAPYLLPRDLRPKPKGGRNEPAFLPHIAEAVSAHCGRALAEVVTESTRNAMRFFGFY